MGEQDVTAFDIWGQRERAPLRRLPSLLWDSLRLVRAAGARDALLVVVLQAVAALGAAAQVLVGRDVLETIAAGDRPGAAVAGVAVLAAVTAAVGAAQALSRERDQVLGELVGRHAQGRILDVAAAVELSAFETPELHNRLQRAAVSAQYGPLQLVNGVVALASGVLGIVALVVTLLALQPLLVGVALLAGLPLIASSIRRGRLYHDFLSRFTPTERERNYLEGLLTDRDAAKEVRAFALAPLLRGRWDRLSEERVAELRRVVRAQLRLTLLGGLGGSVLFGASLALLAVLLTSGRLSLAEGGAAAGALLLLGGRIQGAGIGADLLFEAAPFVQDLRAFLSVEHDAGKRRGTASAPAGFARVAVDGVGFTYPSGSEPALHDISLELRAGEVVALVGENGSGKTTLAKLLAGLYVPDRGSIRWDGIDTSSVEADGLRGRVAILFQDFRRYSLPARDNVGFGRPERAGDLAEIVAAAQRAGAHAFLAALADGYDTVLGPEFVGGTDLSGGQWQRVALARAFFRDAPLVILDEPTAALDARAEHDLFASVRELCQGRTVVLISHRFASVRTADRTYVLHEGRVVESGSHEELMALGGRYAELYTLQAEPYTEPQA